MLASGHGSNLQALIDAIGARRLDAELVGVFSDKVDAFALERARRAGVPAFSLSPRDFASRLEFDEQLFSRVDDVHPDVIVCAGYMRLVSEREVDARAGRMINIHPSLLPAYTGLNTHARALTEGVKIHGCTVHFVTPSLDKGPIIAQAAVPVLPGDTEETLRARVLEQEHKIYPQAIRWFAEDRLTVTPDCNVILQNQQAVDMASCDMALRSPWEPQ